MLALLGPSGCGKTTMLRMLAGLIEPSAGNIRVKGKDMTDLPVHKRGMGMVFQSYALFPHMDVARNVAFGLEMRKVDREARGRRVQDALDMVQLGHLAKRRVKELSGGQQQRVALARALVVEPAVLLLDEPLSNLDAKLRDAMRAEIRALVHRLGVTTVFVTHDQDEALSMADEIVVMNEGKVEQVGRPHEIYDLPESRFVADFIGRANLLPGRTISTESDTALVEVAESARFTRLTGGPTFAMTRTSHSSSDLTESHVQEAQTSSSVDRLRGRVEDHSYTGEMLAYSIAVGDHRIEAETLTGFGEIFPIGADVDVTWGTDDSVILTDS